MKASELIKELERMIAEHGDAPVHVFGCQDETTSEVSEIYFSDAFSAPHIRIDP